MVLCYFCLNEFVAIRDTQARIVAAFVADRGEFAVRHTRSADRTRAMRRVNDCLVSETANLLQGIV